jgi:hypothetical protein
VTIREKIGAALAAVFAAVIMMTGFAGMAGAATAAGSALARPADSADCASSVQTHGGVTGNYCSSQEIVADGVELAVPNKAAAYSRVTFKAAGGNPQTDFEFFNPAGAHPDNQKLAEYDPRGVPSGWYLTVSNNGRLVVLKPLQANGTAAGQQWVAVGPDASGGFAWVSEANGRAISDPNGAPYTRATLVSGSGSSFTDEQ